MNRFLLIAIVLFLQQGCTSTPKPKTAEVNNPITVTSSGVITLPPASADNVLTIKYFQPVTEITPKIILGTITANDSEIAFIREGVNQANQVLASKCFKNEILSRKFTENRNLTSQQIYDKLANNPKTMGVIMFTGNWYQNHVSKTDAYDGDGTVIKLNRYFVKMASFVGSTSLHEIEGHGQGFTHYGKKETSVPYQLNDIFDVCAKALNIKIQY